MTSTAIPSPKGETLPNFDSIYNELDVARENLNRRHLNNNDASAGRSARAIFSAMCLLDTAKATLSTSSSEDVRREALEEAAKAIEAKHTNNVGMVHPMALDDAKAIRALSQKE